MTDLTIEMFENINIVHCKTAEEWEILYQFLKNKKGFNMCNPQWQVYKHETLVYIREKMYGDKVYEKEHGNRNYLSLNPECTLNDLKI